MFVVKKTAHEPIAVIRAASGYELSNYEKQKLNDIEPNAQVNVIEAIKVNDVRLDPVGKEVQINLGNLAFENIVTSEMMSDDLFFITCELDDSDLLKGDS